MPQDGNNEISTEPITKFAKGIKKRIGKSPNGFPPILFVRLIGLEPTRIAAPDPKSGVSTNSTTGAT